METLTLKKEAIDIINKLPENKVQTIVLFAKFLSNSNDSDFDFSAKTQKHHVLESLSGSVKDDSFVRPEQPIFSDDAERKAL